MEKKSILLENINRRRNLERRGAKCNMKPRCKNCDFYILWAVAFHGVVDGNSDMWFPQPSILCCILVPPSHVNFFYFFLMAFLKFYVSFTSRCSFRELNRILAHKNRGASKKRIFKNSNYRLCSSPIYLADHIYIYTKNRRNRSTDKIS